jgi:cobalt-zinc-cadmium resistance protein CzcA
MTTEPGGLRSIVRFSLENRIVVGLGVFVVAALGWRSAVELPIDAVPDITNVQVQVLTSAPALGPAEVEQFITSPIESVMSGLPRLEEIRSVSKFGLSAITLVFEEGTDIYFARQLVGERLDDARESIPEGFGSPEMGPISSGLGEIFQFEVRGAEHSAEELRALLDWFIAPQLRSVEGVVEVNAFGGRLKTYDVEVDPVRMAALGLSLGEIFEAIERNNANAGGAYIERAGEQYLVRGEGLVGSISDIESIVLASREGGTPLLVRHVARVRVGSMVRQGAVTRDGRGEVTTGIVMMLLGANSRDVVTRVQAKVHELQRSMPPGVRIDPFYDRNELVDRTIRTVAINLAEGGALVVLVLLFLLGDLRGGLVVASAIPLSMLVAFIGMRLAGLSANLMSLGAMDFGLLVDGSVVIVEHALLLLAVKRASGADVPGVVLESTAEVARPTVFAVSIILLVYLPILTLTGIEGKMFKPMALTVIFAVLGSLVVALTVMPVLTAWVFRRGVRDRETWLLRLLRPGYRRMLEWTTTRPRLVLGAGVLAFLASGAFVPFLGAEFIPTLEEGSLAIQAFRLPSVSIEESIRATTRLEQVLKSEFPREIDTVVSKTGRAEIATDPMGVEISDVIIMLKPERGWRFDSKEELLEAIDRTLRARVRGQVFSYSQPIELRFSELIAGVRSDVAIKVFGPDFAVLEETAARIVKAVSRVPGAADVKAEQSAGLPVLRVKVDRVRIARHGINVSDVLDAVSAIGGRPVGEVVEEGRRFTIQVRLAERARGDVEAIRRIPIRAPSGILVPLGDLATLLVEDGPAQVSREAGQRKVTVEANVRGRDLAGFVREAQERVNREVRLPSGYVLDWGGQFENLEAASARLGVAVPLSLFLIFSMLFLTFRALTPAFIIFLNVPFAAIGGILALALRGLPLSISAAVGFIALFGVAVLNGVVLVSHVRSLEARGTPPLEAAREGASARLRPVLMTALVAALGFVPMALSTSAGAEVQRPLATVVIGGLITSTILTLLVVPATYALFSRPSHHRRDHGASP